eukprot:11018020-Alexandrium_andersonii.AAC.1
MSASLVGSEMCIRDRVFKAEAHSADSAAPTKRLRRKAPEALLGGSPGCREANRRGCAGSRFKARSKA